jgi:thymidine phosphorylase
MTFSQVDNGLDYVLYAVTGFALVWLVISFSIFVGQKIQEPRSRSSEQLSAEPQTVETTQAIADLVEQNQDLKDQALRLAQQVEELQAQMERSQTAAKKMRQGITTQATHQDLTEVVSQHETEKESLMQQVIGLHRDEGMSNRAIAKRLGVARNKVNGIVREYKQSLGSESGAEDIETENQSL